MSFQLKAVIFDIDGVLLDSLSVWRDLGKRYIIRLGLLPVPGMEETLFPMSMEQGASWLKTTFSLKVSEKEIIRQLETELAKYYFEEVPAKPGAGELLRFLAENRIPAVAATSSPRLHVQKALERNGLLSYLRNIYTTAEIGESKYSPLIYQTAAKACGAIPPETFVVEDSLYALQTAENAGFQTAGIYDAFGETEQEQLQKNADIYCRNLKELREQFISLIKNGG